MKKQTAVKTIFEKFNLMSDADFKSWMLNNHDELERMEKEQVEDAHIEGQRVFDNYQHTQWTTDQAEQYYNETYK
jgi:hypothetical protein